MRILTEAVTFSITVIMMMFANDKDNYDNYMDNDYNKDDLNFSLRL